MLCNSDENLLNIDKHSESQDFNDIFTSHAYLPLITKQTRVTTKSATLIDNIFFNGIVEGSSMFNGILYTDVSDHFPIFHINSNINNIQDKIIYLLSRQRSRYDRLA